MSHPCTACQSAHSQQFMFWAAAAPQDLHTDGKRLLAALRGRGRRSCVQTARKSAGAPLALPSETGWHPHMFMHAAL